MPPSQSSQSMKSSNQNPNATLIERIQTYANKDLHVQARTLCAVGDYLENCFEYEVGWGPMPGQYDKRR